MPDVTLSSILGTGVWGTITGTLSSQTDLQNALNAKLNSTALSAFGLTLVDDVDAATARTTLGLGNVNNTSDAAKPVSTAQQIALNGKVDSAPTYLVGSNANVTPNVWAGPVADPSTNTPTNSWTDLLSFGIGGAAADSYHTQIARGWFQEDLFVRSKTGTTTYNPWRKIYSSGNLTPDNFVQGINSNRTGTIGSSWNAPLPSGFFESSNATDGPTAGWQWLLNYRHSNTGNQFGWQLTNPIGTNDFYVRGIDGGVPKTWERLHHSGNFDPPTSLLKFIPRSEWAAIKAGTSTYDCGNAIRTAFADTSVKTLLVPDGLFNYSGNLPRTGTGLTIRGESHQYSILRCIGAGGIVFDGGNVNGINHRSPKLDLYDLRIEAAVVNAGTAVSMTYVGGSGSPPLGACWTDVMIVPSTESVGVGHPGFNRGVYGYNCRDVHFHRITVAGNSSTAPHPITPTMTEGMFFDGNGDAIELWLAEIYNYYLETGIKVRNHEGVYIDRYTSLAIHHGIDISSLGPEPTTHITNSYIGSERTGAIIDMMSYAMCTGNTFNSTAPVVNANYRGLVLNRSMLPSNEQTNFSRYSNNKFIGTGYSTRSAGAFTETAVDVISANTTDIVDNDIYDMDVGVRIATLPANVLNRVKNRYRLTDTPENIPRLTREAIGGDVRMVVRGANISVPMNTDTKLNYSVVFEDKGGPYYNTTDFTYRPPTGRYQFNISVRFITGVVVGDIYVVELRKDNVAVKSVAVNGSNNGVVVANLSGIIDAENFANDFTVWVHIVGAAGSRVVQPVDSQTYWDMYAISN